MKDKTPTLRRIELLLQLTLEGLELDTGGSFILYKPIFTLKPKTNAMIFSLTATMTKIWIHGLYLFDLTHVLRVSLMGVLLVAFLASWFHVCYQILSTSWNDFKLFLYCFYFVFSILRNCLWNFGIISSFNDWQNFLDITVLTWCFSFFGLTAWQACGILVPWPGMEHVPLLWKHRVLITGPPGDTLARCFSTVILFNSIQVFNFFLGKFV